MKIAICGSMAFAKEMINAGKELEAKGHKIVIQKDIELHAYGSIKEEDKWMKLKHDVFKDYFNEIKNSDAILVINRDKKGIKNYIGGNSLIEMAFAHVLSKKIFLLNPVPKMSYTDEVEAMKPIIINGDLTKIR